MFLDETYFDFRDTVPNYAYFPRGVNAEWTRNYYHRESYSTIVAHNHERILSQYILDTTDSGVKAHHFREFMLNLVQNLPLHSVLVLDNARIHRAAETIEFFDSYNIQYLFLSPYSPDYNPIELMFGWCKQEIKKEEYIGMQLRDSIERVLGELDLGCC